jgi:hypothetical protein
MTAIAQGLSDEQIAAHYGGQPAFTRSDHG